MSLSHLVLECEGTPAEIAELLEQTANRIRNGATGCRGTEDKRLRRPGSSFVAGHWAMTDDPRSARAAVTAGQLYETFAA